MPKKYTTKDQKKLVKKIIKKGSSNLKAISRKNVRKIKKIKRISKRRVRR